MNYWQKLRRRLRREKKIVVELRRPSAMLIRLAKDRGLIDDRESLTCPVSPRRSYNPNDVRERYCGFCCAYY